MNRLFGWSYPPECSGPPDDFEGPCEICGNSVDDCICPECEQCGSVGDPHCYEHHGLERSDEQRKSLAAMQKIWDESNQKIDDAYGNPPEY
jgi:hypothetical protein